MGLIFGGDTVVITGSGFTNTTNVFFDGIPVLSFTVNSDNQITCVTPPHAAGTVNVTVQIDQGLQTVLVNGFTYQDPPAPSIFSYHS